MRARGAPLALALLLPVLLRLGPRPAAAQGPAAPRSWRLAAPPPSAAAPRGAAWGTADAPNATAGVDANANATAAVRRDWAARSLAVEDGDAGRWTSEAGRRELVGLQRVRRPLLRPDGLPSPGVRNWSWLASLAPAPAPPGLAAAPGDALVSASSVAPAATSTT